MKPINILGKKYGRLTVVAYDDDSANTGHAKWICRCSCGKSKIVRASHLKTGNVKSCGCLAREVSSGRHPEISKRQKGKTNSNWKGDKARYSTFHSWMSDHFIKGKFCHHCGKKKKLDWALKKGYKYSRSLNSYFQLCRGCHIKYDK